MKIKKTKADLSFELASQAPEDSEEYENFMKAHDLYNNSYETPIVDGKGTAFQNGNHYFNKGKKAREFRFAKNRIVYMISGNEIGLIVISGKVHTDSDIIKSLGKSAYESLIAEIRKNSDDFRKETGSFFHVFADQQ